MKKSYGFRSKIVHGVDLSKSAAELRDIAEKTHEVLRSAILKILSSGMLFNASLLDEQLLAGELDE